MDRKRGEILLTFVDLQLYYYGTLTQSFTSINYQDEGLHEAVSILHPEIGNSPHVLPEQIQSINWQKISDKLKADKIANIHVKFNPNAYVRNSAECMRRYTKLRGAAKGGVGKAGGSIGPWTEEEDQKVMELVAIHGPKKWSNIACELPGKFVCVQL